MYGMKVNIEVKQKNLQTNQESILCDQICDLELNDDNYTFSYKEKRPLNGHVTMHGNMQGCTINRKAEGTTNLILKHQKQTKGMVESIYGILEIDLYTRRYLKKDNVIAVEYDILNGDEVLESYRLMIKMKKLA